MAIAERCNHATASGAACRMPPVREGGVCKWHEDTPAAAALRREASRRGSRRNLRVLPSDTPDQPLSSIAEVRTALAALYNATVRGELNPRASATANAIASVLLRSYAAEELERRIAAIEAALSAKGGAQ